MEFEWDEAKNQSNIDKHGIDFAQAARIFSGFVVTEVDARRDYGELREISIGLMNGHSVVVVVHTDRNGRCRIISARPAVSSERKAYDKAIRQAAHH